MLTISEMTYEEIAEELESILEKLKNYEVSMDKLESVITRATALSKLCQAKLHNTKLKVPEIIYKLGL